MCRLRRAPSAPVHLYRPDLRAEGREGDRGAAARGSMPMGFAPGDIVLKTFSYHDAAVSCGSAAAGRWLA